MSRAYSLQRRRGHVTRQLAKSTSKMTYQVHIYPLERWAPATCAQYLYHKMFTMGKLISHQGCSVVTEVSITLCLTCALTW